MLGFKRNEQTLEHVLDIVVQDTVHLNIADALKRDFSNFGYLIYWRNYVNRQDDSFFSPGFMAKEVYEEVCRKTDREVRIIKRKIPSDIIICAAYGWFSNVFWMNGQYSAAILFGAISVWGFGDYLYKQKTKSDCEALKEIPIKEFERAVTRVEDKVKAELENYSCRLFG